MPTSSTISCVYLDDLTNFECRDLSKIRCLIHINIYLWLPLVPSVQFECGLYSLQSAHVVHCKYLENSYSTAKASKR